MKALELRNLSPEELTAKVAELTQEYHGVREAVRAGKEKNHGRLKQLRRAIARARTIARPAA